MIAKEFELEQLDARRRKLGMSYASLAKRSGVSMATVQRVLSGNHPKASFGNVVAIAEALDMSVKIEPTATATEIRHRRARQKAERLVSMVQATAGLEAQAVSADALSEMMVQTTSELLAGSPRQLWND
jgi:transcriptional regulator with XRE-family HTH domain